MTFRLKHLNHLIVLLALLTLALRSLIPVGFMPDFSGHGKGIFPLVICDGYEHTDANPCPMHASHGGHSHAGLCPFGASSLSSYDPVSVTIEVAANYSEATFLPLPLPLSGNDTVFSNASPRSPPYNS